MTEFRPMHYARCEDCHKTVLAIKGHFVAGEFFVCDECAGVPRVFTMDDVKREESI